MPVTDSTTVRPATTARAMPAPSERDLAPRAVPRPRPAVGPSAIAGSVPGPVPDPSPDRPDPDSSPDGASESDAAPGHCRARSRAPGSRPSLARQERDHHGAAHPGLADLGGGALDHLGGPPQPPGVGGRADGGDQAAHHGADDRARRTQVGGEERAAHRRQRAAGHLGGRQLELLVGAGLHALLGAGLGLGLWAGLGVGHGPNIEGVGDSSVTTAGTSRSRGSGPRRSGSWRGGRAQPADVVSGSSSLGSSREARASTSRLDCTANRFHRDWCGQHVVPEPADVDELR